MVAGNLLKTDSDLMANMYIVLNCRRKLLEHAYGYYGMELKLAFNSLLSNHIITIRISSFRSGSRIQEGWYASNPNKYDKSPAGFKSTGSHELWQENGFKCMFI
jgi:hypothetical protein